MNRNDGVKGRHGDEASETTGPARIKTLGTVTIGQSPRPDLIPELRMAMGLGAEGPGSSLPVNIIEAGALDGLTLGEVRQLAPNPGDYVLVTRMADGTPVTIAERHILPRMVDKISRLVEEGADVVALVCTGEFPELACEKLLVVPQPLLLNVVSALARGRKLGVLLPDEEQIEQGYERWSLVHGDRERAWQNGYCGLTSHKLLKIEAASPYGDPRDTEKAAARLRDWGADLVVMDCIGYTMAMKEKVGSITGAPVILARSIVGRVLAELL